MKKQIIDQQDLLNAIEVTGRIVGQLLDGWHKTTAKRNSALSEAHNLLGATYFKATGRPLAWWYIDQEVQA